MRAVDTLRAWWASPDTTFVPQQFRVTPDYWQGVALRAFVSDDKITFRIALKACAGPGKSAVLAWCIWLFISCKGDKDNHPKGAVVSITKDNLEDNLWSELSKWQERSEFLMAAFTWRKTRIESKTNPSTWWISARSWSKTANAEEQGRTLSGLHAEDVLIVVDESGDVPPSVLRAAEQALTSCRWGKIIQAGNPTSQDGMLYIACNDQSHLWTVITITGDPDDPARSKRIDIEWAREQIRLYGRENPWVMAYILGLFPPSSLNALLGHDEMRAAIGRVIPETAYNFSQKRIGIDMSRFGDDATILFPRQGLAAFEPVKMRGVLGNPFSVQVASRIMAAKNKWKSEIEFIDDTGGWGSGVIDYCQINGVHLVPVNASTTARDRRYFNTRSELNFLAAEWVKKGGALPNNPELIRQACAVEYWFDKGCLRVIEKDQIKAKLNGQSPDEWDAFCLTFAQDEMTASTYEGIPLADLTRRRDENRDWNPYEQPSAVSSNPDWSPSGL